jgi:hypothetical protein
MVVNNFYMKFALVNGLRHEAAPKLVGQCIGCENPVLAKCGERRINHWAHKARIQCDPWWETETEWHRAWKDQFPSGWQEVIHIASDGQKHVADIKTPDDWVIEFQHSYINPKERRSREDFYKKLIWVVDGSRRSRDKTRFFKVLSSAGPNNLWPDLRVTFAEGVIFNDWIASYVHVIYDFGDEDLWCLFPQSNELWAYLLPISRFEFIKMVSGSGLQSLDQWISQFSLFLSKYKSPRHLVQSLQA